MGRISTPYKPVMYSGFVGLSTARSDIASENAEAQPCVEMDNLYATNKGYITNEPGILPYNTDDKSLVSHLRQVGAGTEQVVYAARVAGGTSLRSVEGNRSVDGKWPRNASVSSAVFNGQVVLAAGQSSMYAYDGFDFKEITSASIKGGKYLCAVQNRLVVAGFSDPARVNELAISRVNNAKVYVSDEAPGDATVTQAARINVQNQLQTGDSIRGLGAFESGKLAVFTNDRALIYKADPDYTKWALDDTVQVNFGTISHKSIVSVAGEIFFCSRAGVHSLRRSMLNGAVVFTMPMSDEITELYQSLVAMVQNHDDISAFFDQDDGRLHIFFPVNDLLSYRLSAALSLPQAEQESTKARWSLSAYGGLTCGERLAGRTVVGSISGMAIFEPARSAAGDRGNGSALFPVLYHKDIFNTKSSLQIVLFASGSGRIHIDAHDETGRDLGNGIFFDLPADDQADYFGVPLQRQFTRPFARQYIGLRLKVRVESKKPVRIYAVGVLLKKED